MNQDQHDLAVKEIIVSASTGGVGTTVARLVRYFGIEAVEPALNEAFDLVNAARREDTMDLIRKGGTRTFVADDTAVAAYRMADAPTSPNFTKNFSGVSKGEPCNYCGKAVMGPQFGVWVNDDGSMLIHRDDLKRRIESGDADDDMGMTALGPDCAARLKSPEFGLGDYVLGYNEFVKGF